MVFGELTVSSTASFTAHVCVFPDKYLMKMVPLMQIICQTLFLACDMFDVEAEQSKSCDLSRYRCAGKTDFLIGCVVRLCGHGKNTSMSASEANFALKSK